MFIISEFERLDSLPIWMFCSLDRAASYWIYVTNLPLASIGGFYWAIFNPDLLPIPDYFVIIVGAVIWVRQLLPDPGLFCDLSFDSSWPIFYCKLSYNLLFFLSLTVFEMMHPSPTLPSSFSGIRIGSLAFRFGSTDSISTFLPSSSSPSFCLFFFFLALSKFSRLYFMSSSTFFLCLNPSIFSSNSSSLSLYTSRLFGDPWLELLENSTIAS